VALSLLFMAAGLAIPFVQSLAAVITLITIAVSAAHVGPAAHLIFKMTGSWAGF
jgi:hypothetical protein